MTQEEFIEVLDEKGYSYKIEGDKIIVTQEGYLNFYSLTSLPPDVEFRNKGSVHLYSLTSIHPGVEFNNGGIVGLDSLIGKGEWFEDWKGNIKGIDSKRLLNKMVADGLFDRR